MCTTILGLWFAHSMTCVLLAFNRVVEIFSREYSKKLFKRDRIWLWMIIPTVYGLMFATSLDTPPIYNSVYSVYYFQIDFSEDAEPVVDWPCFLNSCWVTSIMIILYSLLFYKLRRRTRKYVKYRSERRLGVAPVMQKKAAFQVNELLKFVKKVPKDFFHNLHFSPSSSASSSFWWLSAMG